MLELSSKNRFTYQRGGGEDIIVKGTREEITSPVWTAPTAKSHAQTCSFLLSGQASAAIASLLLYLPDWDTVTKLLLGNKCGYQVSANS